MSNRPVKKRGELLHSPPGVVSDAEAVPVVLCIQWKEQGQWGVDCISWAFLNKTPSLLSTPLSLIFMLLGMHSEAAGTPGSWRGALLIPPFSTLPFFTSSFFLPKTGLRGTFLQKAAWAVLYLFTLRPRPSCMFGKTMQVETLHPPHCSGFFKEKALQQCCSSLKRRCLWK